ncbi:hypothetical protein HAX54_028267 [Datura stramonium]|uniref:Uncharacterized protein n=1 Tax=Datura stramonium TaxID=4076 RepID=A0ABS8V639_DATST|nr:hypothetical protein [Datura stramonium]
MKTSIEPAGEATGAKLVFQATPINTSTPSTSGAIETQLEGESAETSSLGPFVNRAITVALEPYKHLHARMDDMEEQQPVEFLIAEFEELEDNAPFIDLLGEQPKATKKILRDDVRDEGKSRKKKKHKRNKQEKAKLREALKQSRIEEEMHIEEIRTRVGGTSSSSAPRVERHVIGAIIHSESTTLIILLSATAAATPYPLTATTATIDGSRIIPHRQLCQTLEYRDSQVYPISSLGALHIYALGTMPFFVGGGGTCESVTQVDFEILCYLIYKRKFGKKLKQLRK